MDEGSVSIDTPLNEKRIASVYRGGGPKDIDKMKAKESFDGYLLELAMEKGANLIREKVNQIDWRVERPAIVTRDKTTRVYDLLIGAVGVNTAVLKLFEKLGNGYKAPKNTKTYICEIPLGREKIKEYLGSSMQVFLLNQPRLEFAAIVPKGDYATVCMLGKNIDNKVVQNFLNSTPVKSCLPPNWHVPEKLCHCFPKINIVGAVNSFSDRFVMVGDCGISRLYKDGIGAAYRTAKAAAKTAVFEGITREDFKKYYGPTYKGIIKDNTAGKIIFGLTGQLKKRKLTRWIILQIVSIEQQNENSHRYMSEVLWDTFTGSATYRNIFLRAIRPAFIIRFLWNLTAAIWSHKGNKK